MQADKNRLEELREGIQPIFEELSAMREEDASGFVWSGMLTDHSQGIHLFRANMGLTEETRKEDREVAGRAAAREAKKNAAYGRIRSWEPEVWS